MMNGRESVYVTLLAIIVPTFPAMGFGPLAHHTAAPAAAARHQQSLPDLWKSSAMDVAPTLNPFTLGSVDFTVTEAFTWSHACKKRGQRVGLTLYLPNPILGGFITLTVNVPETPTRYGVPEHIEDPGEDIWYLCQNKLSSGIVSDSMRMTARGFACHNAEDSVVHFTYFLAGDAWNWVVEHSLKETWAEFTLYVAAGGWWEDGWPDSPMSLGLHGDAGMINIAQKVFRKNRQSVDAQPAVSGSRETIAVQTASTISTRISEKDADLSTYFGRGFLGDYIWVTKFYYERYIDFRDMGYDQGWNAMELVHLRHEAHNAAVAAVASMP